MRNLMNIFKLAAVTIFVMTLAAGCILEKDSHPSMNRKDVMILLDVTAGQMQTKAMDESAMKTLRIYAFDRSGSLIGHIYTTDPDASKHHMVLNVPNGQPSLEVDFYAVANEAAMFNDNSHVTLTENMSLSEVKGIVYTSLMNTAEVLPLYGVLNKNLSLEVEEQPHVNGDHLGLLLKDQVSISMSRSLSKIGVYAAAAEGATVKPVISKITLLAPGRRDQSYLFPAEDILARDASIQSMPYERVFDLQADGVDVLSNSGVVDATLNASVSDPSVSVTDYYTEILAPFYLAEVPYGSNDWKEAAPAEGRPVVLLIEYSFGEGTIIRKATINMPPIVRNNFYQVRCLILSDAQILVNVTVNDWEEGEDHTLDFDFPTHSDPLFATDALNQNGNYSHVYGTPATMYYSATDLEKGAFSVDFNMSYPVGGRWTPSVRGSSTSNYELRIYKRGDSMPLTAGYVEVTDADVNDQWYTIKIVPKSASSTGDKIVLSIAYTPVYSGSGYSYLLQINGGEENNLAWSEYAPSDADNLEASTVDIVITQVEEQNNN